MGLRFVMNGRRLASAVAAALALTLPACGAGGIADEVKSVVGGGDPSPTSPTMSSAERADAQEVLARTNEERAKAGLGLLVWDEGASQVAYRHAVDMDARNFFDHVNPDGLDPGSRLALGGVSYQAWGENIAQGQGTPTDVMTSWMNSEHHRDNILTPAWTRLGVGVHYGPAGPWWVQDFVR